MISTMLVQPLTLEFKKSRPRPVLTIRRADGTATWMKLYPGMAMHDLAHFVIETELELNDAFYGILAEGYDIEEFEAPRETRPAALRPENLSCIALQVEHLVNLLLTEMQAGKPLEGFLALFQTILAEADLPLMEQLTNTSLIRIRALISELNDRWNTLPEDELLTLRME